MKTNLILFLVFLGLVATLMGVEWAYSRKADTKLSEEPAKFLLTRDQRDKLTSEELYGVVISPPANANQQPIDLIRVNTGQPGAFWGIERLGGHRIKTRQVSDFLSAFKYLNQGEVAATLDPKATDHTDTLKKYGLDAASVTTIEFFEVVDLQQVIDMSTGQIHQRGTRKPIIALQIGGKPEGTTAFIDAPRFVRLGTPKESAKTTANGEADGPPFEFANEIRLMSKFPDLLTETDLTNWLDLSLTKDAGKPFNPAQIYRIVITGEGMDAPVALQRFVEPPNTIDELAQLQNGPKTWYFSEAERKLLAEIDPTTKVDLNEVDFYLNYLQSMEGTGFSKINNERSLPPSTYLRISLLRTPSLESQIQINKLGHRAFTWQILSQVASQLSDDQAMSIEDFVAIVQQRLGLSVTDVTEFLLGAFLSSNHALDPVFVDGVKAEDGTVSAPPGTLEIPYNGEPRYLRGFRIDGKAVANEAQMLRMQMQELVPQGFDRMVMIYEKINQAQEQLMRVPRNSPQFQRITETLNGHILELDFFMYRNFADVIDLVIVRDREPGEPAQTQPQSQPAGTFKIATSANGYRYWYDITPDMVTQLKKLKADFEPVAAEPQTPQSLPNNQAEDTGKTSGQPNPRVKLTTNFGEIVLEMFEDEAPNSVANFISLVEQGFYDGTRIHRIVSGFVIQGGDPTTKAGIGPGAGMGGPGYAIPDEITPARHFDAAGLLAMANSGPNTSGSQFFITLAPTPQLDDGPGRHYNLFGHVIEGMDAVQKIAAVPTGPSTSGENSRPLQDVIIEKAEVIQKRDHAYTVKKVGE